MPYQILDKDEQDDIIVSFILSQERDKFCHELNLARYGKILLSATEGEWKNKITQLRTDTSKRLNEVTSIIEASKTDMPSAERIVAALARLKAKEAK